MALKNKPFKKILNVLKGVAPTAVAALGGPYAPLAATVMRNVLGKPDSSDEELEAEILAVAGNPDAVIKLKEIESELQAKEAELNLRFYELTTQDRADARARQVALKDNMPAVVLVLTSLGFYGTLSLLFFKGLPMTGAEVILSMVGALGSAWGASVAYFVGSSAGSSKKTDILANGNVQ